MHWGGDGAVEEEVGGCDVCSEKAGIMWVVKMVTFDSESGVAWVGFLWE